LWSVAAVMVAGGGQDDPRRPDGAAEIPIVLGLIAPGLPIAVTGALVAAL
jgi:hypothetical protein